MIAACPTRRRFLWRGVAAGCVMAALAVVAFVSLRGMPIGSVLADARPGWVAAAVMATMLSLAAAAHNLSAFTPLRIRARDVLRAQLAVCGLRIVAPPALSTPAISARFLIRAGLGAAEALAVVATAQLAQLVMTILVVGAIAGGSGGLPVPGGGPWLLAGVGPAVQQSPLPPSGYRPCAACSPVYSPAFSHCCAICGGDRPG